MRCVLLRHDRLSLRIQHRDRPQVQRFDPGTVVVSQGLDGGEVVVTAGIQVLYPGRKVRLLGSPS